MDKPALPGIISRITPEPQDFRSFKNFGSLRISAGSYFKIIRGSVKQL
jgi:hypothetical protein